jgi:predicted porin
VKRIAIFVVLACMFAPAIANAAEWYEKLKLKGDVRFRDELIQQQDKKDNFRWRIRARIAAEAEINEAWSAVIGLASGSDDPVSTNQTLTGGFSRKTIMLDLAYVDFHPKQAPGT